MNLQHLQTQQQSQYNLPKNGACQQYRHPNKFKNTRQFTNYNTLIKLYSNQSSIQEKSLGTQVQTPQIQVSQAYPFTEIEKKWQKLWEEKQTFKTPDFQVIDKSKPKYYVLDMFPYPSGAGLHVGHPEGYTATDIIARYKRMRGFNVLHPMGWDAFGLPAEQYAIQTGQHPRITTIHNINRFRSQLKSLGFSYDWSREISTTDPQYVKWTQWIFLQLFKNGLAYKQEVPVNWCPELGAILANEEVIDGKSERGNYPVYRVPLMQWMLKITNYADRLLSDLDDLDWSDSIKEMQRNWIGRSEGAEVKFDIQVDNKDIQEQQKIQVDCFTTRPDTLFGATYLVMAPENPLVKQVTSQQQQIQVQDYVQKAQSKSELERSELQKKKTGVFTGAYAVNPVNLDKIPIYVADYVIGSYGSGAIMAVPAHDSRDYEFAQQYNLQIKQVVQNNSNFKDNNNDEKQELPFTGQGININSSSQQTGLDINDLNTADAKQKMIQWLQDNKKGSSKISYRLKDWLFARQRYWGEPFPLIYPLDNQQHSQSNNNLNGNIDNKQYNNINRDNLNGNIQNNQNEQSRNFGALAVDENDLPVLLPEMKEFKHTGSLDSPLATVLDWAEFTDQKTGKRYKRETLTMPQWAGSCWYYLRFIDPQNSHNLIDKESEKYWMPVDLYVGGAEHAVLHLLYARFWHKVLYDIGVVNTKEPFQSLVSQGMILGETEFYVHKTQQGEYVDEKTEGAQAIRVDESSTTQQGKKLVLQDNPDVEVTAKSFKMSKSKGNVINPDDIVTQYGADSFRLYEMFMGPLTDTKVWNTKGVEGVHRFLARVYRLFQNEIKDVEADREQLRQLHLTIYKVTQDTEQMGFNTAIAAMMEFVNNANKWQFYPKQILEDFILILSPYAPHICEELWSELGHNESLAYQQYPQYVEEYLKADTISLPIQINGKMRDTLDVSPEIPEEEAVKLAKEQPKLQKFIESKTIIKIIYRQGKILNLIVK